MGFTVPDSMDECLFFTRRTLDNDGKVMAWVERKLCTECGKEKMGKPQKSDGGVKIRAPIYVCPGCGHEEDKKSHEESCELKAIYTCPSCKKEGEGSTPYKRKKYKGVDAFVVECEHCGEKIPITKKMKDIKKKK